MTTAEKVRENRLRRMAERQGLRLVKSRRRDPRAIDYGGWMIVDPSTNAVVAGVEGVGRPFWTLDDVEAYLTGDGGGTRPHLTHVRVSEVEDDGSHQVRLAVRDAA